MHDRKGTRRVLLSPFTCESVLTAVTAAQLEPVFIDFSAASSFVLDLAVLQRHARPEPGCDIVLYTHLFGFSPGYADLADFCRSAGLFLLEDGAHVTPDWPRSNACRGDAAIFSFGVSKPLNLGMGGAAWIKAELRGEFHEYAAALPHVTVSFTAAVARLFLAQLKTNSLLLGIAAGCGLTERTSSSSAHRPGPPIRATRWTELHPFQTNLLEELLANFASVHRLRHRSLAGYREALEGLPELKLQCAEAELLGNNAPVRIMVTVPSNRRTVFIQSWRSHGLWAHTWIPSLLSTGAETASCCPNAAVLVERFVTLPTGFSRRSLLTPSQLRHALVGH